MIFACYLAGIPDFEEDSPSLPGHGDSTGLPAPVPGDGAGLPAPVPAGGDGARLSDPVPADSDDAGLPAPVPAGGDDAGLPAPVPAGGDVAGLTDLFLAPTDVDFHPLASSSGLEPSTSTIDSPPSLLLNPSLLRMSMSVGDMDFSDIPLSDDLHDCQPIAIDPSVTDATVTDPTVTDPSTSDSAVAELVCPTTAANEPAADRDRPTPKRVSCKRLSYFEKHVVKDAPFRCSSGACKHQCASHISDEWRAKICTEVNELDRDGRRQWYRSHVKRADVMRRRQRPGAAANSRRGKSLIWTLPRRWGGESVTGEGGVGPSVQVCKGFFLTTLGFREGSDSVVLEAVSGGQVVAPLGEKRGRKPAANKVSEEDIQKHIMSFHPVPHHYRYQHAPRRMYNALQLKWSSLSSDLFSVYRTYF